MERSRWSSPAPSDSSQPEADPVDPPPLRTPPPDADSSASSKRKREDSPTKKGCGYDAEDLYDENGNSLPPPELRLMKYSTAELENRRSKHGSQRCILDRQKFESEFDVSTLDLTPEQRRMWDRNPHLRQLFVNRRPLIVSPQSLSPTDGMVTPVTPTTKYRRRFGEVKTVEHWGQRKLLFSEIAFLLRYADADLHRVQQVLYAGAAPGNHTNFLSDLFPQMRFHLVDPAPFSAKPTDKITLENAFFTQETATAWKGRTDLFISDIRAITWTMSDAEKEAQVAVDMKWQQDWVQEIVPSASMLKFRLPYKKGQTDYLDGWIMFPVWGGRTTSESRLVVTQADHYDTDAKQFRLKPYDHGWYEDVMFHFNTETRTTYFPHDVPWEEGDGLDHCFDCASELAILEEYIRKYKTYSNQADLKNKVLELSRRVSGECSSAGRTLKVRLKEEDEQ